MCDLASAFNDPVSKMMAPKKPASASPSAPTPTAPNTVGQYRTLPEMKVKAVSVSADHEKALGHILQCRDCLRSVMQYENSFKETHKRGGAIGNRPHFTTPKEEFGDNYHFGRRFPMGCQCRQCTGQRSCGVNCDCIRCQRSRVASVGHCHNCQNCSNASSCTSKGGCNIKYSELVQMFTFILIGMFLILAIERIMK